MNPVEPVTLPGHHVRLEPLSLEHVRGLLEAAQDETIWRYTLDDPREPAAMLAYVERAIGLCERGEGLAFAVRQLATGRVVGSTRYAAIDRPNHGLEIGWTWYEPGAQRTAVNTECKLLLFEHAFERLECIRVELKTDARNARSRQAILRLGAIEEGTLRSKAIMRDGHRRDSVYYSVLDHEWPAVRQRLQALLEPD